MPLRLIPTKTAAGTCALPAVRVRELVLRQTARPAAIRACVRCSRRSLLADGGFCAIVNPAGGEGFAEPDAAAGRTKTQLPAAQGAAPPADHTKGEENATACITAHGAGGPVQEILIICIRLPDYAYYINGPETLPPPLSKEEEKVVLPAWRPETLTAAMCLSFTICGWWSTSQKKIREQKRPLWRT